MEGGRRAVKAIARLTLLANAKDAEFLRGYFKTGAGEYGEGDRFLGIRVPVLRKLARDLRGSSLDEMAALLDEPWHEARLLAVIMLVDAYERGDEAVRAAVFKLYLANRDRVNNWDIVDSSAARIVGAHLLTRPRDQLYRLAKSKSVWDRRIAVIATHAFIRNGEFDDTERLAGALMRDEHDLMHKAVGWMLRELGARDATRLARFLDEHASHMPRTMLRYAIEKFPTEARRKYMAIKQ